MSASSEVATMHLAPGHTVFDTRVFHKECKSLRDAGYRVTLVAPHDRHETIDGVEIVPLPHPRSRAQRFLSNTWRAFKIAWRTRADVYHLHDIEMIPVGTVLALAGRTVIFDSHEDYPRLVRDRQWLPRMIRPVLPAFVRLGERLLLRPVSAIISAEAEGARRFPRERVTVVRNHVLESEFACMRPLEDRDAGMRAIYVGAMSRERGIVECVEAVWAARDLGARLTLIGAIESSELRGELRAGSSWSCVDYLGHQDRATVLHELARARLGLVLLQPTRKYREGAVPVKLLEYLAAGLPVIASDFPSIRSITGDSGAAILVDPSDRDEIAWAVRRVLGDQRLAAEMGAKGRELALGRFGWSSEARALQGRYSSVVGGRNRGDESAGAS